MFTNTQNFNRLLCVACLFYGIQFIDLHKWCSTGDGQWIAGYSSDNIHVDTLAGLTNVGAKLAAVAASFMPAQGLEFPYGTSQLKAGLACTFTTALFSGGNPPTGYTGSFSGSGVVTHSSEDPANAGTAAQTFRGTGWRQQATTQTTRLSGLFNSNNTLVPLQWYVAWFHIKIAVNGSVASADVAPLVRYQQTSSDGSANHGRLDWNPSIGQTHGDVRIAFLFRGNSNAAATRLDFAYGAIGSTARSWDMTLGEHGVFPIRTPA